MVKIPVLLSFFHICVYICFGKLDLRNVISYKAMNYSYYKPWNLRGELTFNFKTSQRDGLLVYQDDSKHSFIEVFLVEGNVRFKACLGSCDHTDYEVFIRENFADGFWHKLRIRRDSKNCTFFVDNNVTSLPCKGSLDSRFKYYGNFLYVANFNPVVSLNNLVFPGAFHEGVYYRFQGCIGDVRFTNNNGELVEAALKHTTGERGCTSACAAPKVNQCQNKGKCVDKIGHVVCECAATGYEGPLCSEPSSSLFVNGSGYVLYDVGTHHPGRSTVGNNIAFRFATTNPSGVLLLTDLADDHVIVELVNGFLRVSWDLGEGGLVLMSRQGCLHDAVWHSVTINRLQRRIKITVDDQRPIQALIPGKFSYLDFKGGSEHMVFGGGPLTKAFNRSLSRANFTGFLQQLQFDEFDVIDETIAGKTFNLIGNAVLNASSLFHLIHTSPSPLANCSREVDPDKESLCEGLDDEDMCGSLAAASGDGLPVPDCETTGTCSTSDSIKSTDNSSVIQAFPNSNSSSNNMTSLTSSSTSSTTSSTTSTVNTSQVHFYSTRAGNSTMLPSSPKQFALITTSSGVQRHDRSLLSTQQISPTMSIASTVQVMTTAASPTAQSAINSSSSVYDTYMNTSNNSLFTSIKSTPTRPMSDTFLTASTPTSSVDNATVMAYMNDVTKTTGRPACVVGSLLLIAATWCLI